MLEWWMQFAGIEQVLVVAAVVSLMGLLFYYFFFFLRVGVSKSRHARPLTEDALPPVSVIICARNEVDNIIEHLPKILKQNYPNFEVVVVNDVSWDGTGDELAEMQKTNSHLQVVEIGEHIQHRPGKKFPLTLGIKKAVHEHLVFTDADCIPAGEDWLRHLASSFGDSKEIIVAPAPLLPTKGLLNAISRFETYLTGTFFLSFALAGVPYMGVGRNLAYRRAAYDRVGGFKKHYHIMSGDDDLFVQEAANIKNVGVCLNREALVYSQSAKTWQAWWRQKRRHYSTAPHYRSSIKLLLALYPLFLGVFLMASIWLLVYENTQPIAMGLIALKMMLQIVIFRLVFSVQNDRWLWLFSPFLEVILLANQLSLTIVGWVSKQSRWK